MIIDKQVFSNMINSPVRRFQGRVEIFEGSTLATICTCHDKLKSFTVERIGEESKFFGFGICQKLQAKFIDKNRELNITKAHSLEVEFGINPDFIYPCPAFHVYEVSRDENTNDLDVIAYDALYNAKDHIVSELVLPVSYTLRTFASEIARVLGVPLTIDSAAAASFELLFTEGANFEGTENLRRALDAIAEATQTIYFIDHNWRLTFKRLDVRGEPVLTIDKSKYMTLTSEDARKLTTIVHTTELSDTVTAATGANGATQVIRDNPFWNLRNDVGVLLDAALTNAGNLTINPFECTWRGNFLLEIGDKVNLVTKDDSVITAFILDDTMTFNGALSGKSRWVYQESNTGGIVNPTSLGDAIYQTYARVDKVNKQIELVASAATSQVENISALRLDVNGISTEVKKISTLETTVNELTGEVSTVKEELRSEFQQTATDAVINFEQEITTNGVTKVSGTGYKFDINGLTINKTDAPTQTTITENGMTVTSTIGGGADLLTVNDNGVKAKDLQASSYLIVGTNSRFENYGSNRTACYWIGG